MDHGTNVPKDVVRGAYGAPVAAAELAIMEFVA
jgi:hypothetical protein